MSLLQYSLTRKEVQRHELQGVDVFEWAKMLATNTANVTSVPESLVEDKKAREVELKAGKEEVVIIEDEPPQNMTKRRSRSFGFNTLQDLENQSQTLTPMASPHPFMIPLDPDFTHIMVHKRFFSFFFIYTFSSKTL